MVGSHITTSQKKGVNKGISNQNAVTNQNLQEQCWDVSLNIHVWFWIKAE